MSPGSSAARRLPAEAEAASVFAALGDATRLHLVARLSNEGPQSVSALTAGAGVTRQAVTKHLTALGDAGLARSARRGRQVIWSLETRRLEIARRHLDHVSKSWDHALERLRAFVET
jgi:DNA-binding transcriptional ArsR family regulator